MAVLQAARASALGLPAASARSWGLNRAIFYAAAKRGFKGTPGKAPAPVPVKSGGRRAAVREFMLGDDKAYRVTVEGKALFTIGGEIQTPEAFERQIAQRFGGSFRAAWDEALRIVGAYPKAVLESQNGFYEHVYRPRRDELAKRWTDLAAQRESGEGAS
jgi:hypothetical protein